MGLAFDNDDSHSRLTRGTDSVLVGGSRQTHAEMRETALKINVRLARRGKRLEDCSLSELCNLCRGPKVRSAAVSPAPAAGAGEPPWVNRPLEAASAPSCARRGARWSLKGPSMPVNLGKTRLSFHTVCHSLASLSYLASLSMHLSEIDVSYLD